MVTWRSVNMQCDCCGKTRHTPGASKEDARRIAQQQYLWSVDRTGAKDWCPECTRFACKGRH